MYILILTKIALGDFFQTDLVTLFSADSFSAQLFGGFFMLDGPSLISLAARDLLEKKRNGKRQIWSQFCDTLAIQILESIFGRPAEVNTFSFL
jgi:hypothetical protein